MKDKHQELREKIKSDALFNPMIGWCTSCDRKPFPYIEVNGKVVNKEDKTTSPEELKGHKDGEIYD